MFSYFIKKPILSSVISIMIVLVGAIALYTLPITQYPDIIPPSVIVTTSYTGANADECSKAVVIPLERAINGVPKMTYMTSVSSNDGTSIIQVYFQVGTDPDLASVNVQNRVSTILDELPQEVIKAGVTVEKEVNSMLLYLNLISKDTTLDEQYIFNFADINLMAELKRIDGVGFVDIMGVRDYAMRIWLKPDKMVAYNISADEVVGALQKQNIGAAPGKIGESSDKKPQMLQYVLKYTGKYTTPEEYGNIVLRASNDGSILRLKDISKIELGSQDYTVFSKENGKPSAAIMLKQRPGSNAREVIHNVKTRMAELKEMSFPPGMEYTITYDVSRFLDASINEVLKTIIEAFILVSLVVFIFLQDIRSTIIPALAVPVSIIGTFAFMSLMGFSINLITLFALVLSIGIVVDNAIVVVEAVHAKMENYHLKPKAATFAAMEDISGAIIAITFVMSSVFIPVAFLPGPVGIFYRQFSITLATAIVISGINAVTLTPALCAILLKHKTDQEPTHKKLSLFFDWFNKIYSKLSDNYKSVIEKIVNRRTVTYGSLVVFIIGTIGIGSILPSSFIPTEDQGMIYVNVSTPAGATLERTNKVMDEIQAIAKEMDAVETTSTLAGFSMMTDGYGSTFGMGMINLKPWDERSKNVDEIIKDLEIKTAKISDASIQFFPPPSIPGFGNSSGFEMRIQDRTGSGDMQKLAVIAKDFVSTLNERPEIEGAFSSFDPNFPQYLIHIDQEIAAQKGVSIEAAMDNLQMLIGSFYATNFIRFGQLYKVMIQALPEYRAKPDDLLKLSVKNSYGEMVPYSAFTRLERIYGAEQLTRYNMFLSAMVNGQPSKGFTTGAAIDAIKEVAATKLPRGYTYEWSGMTREEVLAGNQSIYIFIISLLFVYLLLAAQYESFVLPLSVILSLPAGIFGALLFLKLFGLDNNIYAQVSMIMLIGLLGKNAILIVEFAVLKHKEGMTILEAAIEGANIRLRPILMTSFAFIAGLIPLAMASGAGAIGNRTIGSAAIGGMFIGTVFGLIVIPGLYIVFASIADKSQRKNKQHGF